ncbi:MAG TPA: TRAP transporter TatT component family protein, partial [Rectinemataceae bacterium]|nr:TRAP transporter TatT component family protein [Rectinemataceae bacterium]
GLAAGAMPTLIKVEEGILAAKPKDQAAIVQTAQLYVMYGNAFVQGPAQDLDAQHYQEKQAADLRARALYRRAFAILGPALDRRAPGIVGLWRNGTAEPIDPAHPEKGSRPKGGGALLDRFGTGDLPLLYWSSASILAAYAVAPLDLREASIVGLAKALLDRGLAIDPAWNEGSLEELAVSVYSSFPAELGGDPATAMKAYRRGLEITKGRSASLYVTYASTICVANDDFAGFKTSLAAALAIDPDANPKTRLATTIAQANARRMLAHAGDYFLEATDAAPGQGSQN